MARSCHDAFDDATPARGIYELAAGASRAAWTHGAAGRHGVSRAVGTTGGNSSAVARDDAASYACADAVARLGLPLPNQNLRRGRWSLSLSENNH